MANEGIKRMISSSGLRFWQIAQSYGCSDSTFSRKLRIEFSTAEKERIIKIIEELKGAP